MSHQLPAEDWIDLHPFRPAEIEEVVEEFLTTALESGHREVRIVHGRGIGVQRETVRSLLKSHPHVEAFGDAPESRGGWGATLVQLSRQPLQREQEPAPNRQATSTDERDSGSLWGTVALIAVLLLACLFLAWVVWQQLGGS